MISASSFALVPRYEVNFTSSCGRAATLSTNAPFGSASLTAELTSLNSYLCPGAGAITITYNP